MNYRPISLSVIYKFATKVHTNRLTIDGNQLSSYAGYLLSISDPMSYGFSRKYSKPLELYDILPQYLPHPALIYRN